MLRVMSRTATISPNRRVRFFVSTTTARPALSVGARLADVCMLHLAETEALRKV
jgi:hypothetical protein